MARRLVAFAGAGLLVGALPAPAAASSGACTDVAGVTVVVDAGSLGGGVSVRCADDLGAGRTGVDALRQAGHQVEGVRRWGDSFVCRIDGRPAVGADLPLDGDPGYRERCIDTPPAGAYWSYWYAADGGQWTYSSSGARNRSPEPGGFEGWSFSLGSPSPPAVAPTRPKAPSSPAPDPVRSATQPPPPPPSGSAGGAGGAGGAGAPAPRDTRTENSTDGQPRATAPTGRPATPSPPPAQEQQAQPASRTPSPPGAPLAPPAAGPASGSGGPPVATLVGGAGLAFLVTIALGTAWLRRRP